MNVNNQFRRYIGHVTTNIGGIYEDLKSNDQEGSVYNHVPKNIQKNIAINLILIHLISFLLIH